MPLPNATVKVRSTQKGAVTASDGSFQISGLCKKEFHLEVDFLGYKHISHHHDIYHESPEIYLAPDSIQLEGIIVEEELSPESLTTLSAVKRFYNTEDLLGRVAGEVMADQSGVTVLSTGTNISKPILQGLHSNRVLIINNGLRHAYQAWGREHAPELSVADLEVVQVIKGAGTVRYGSDALGGVIKVHKAPTAIHAPFSGQITSGYATNGRAGSLAADFEKGYNKWAIQGGVYAIKQGDLRAPDYHLTNTGRQEWSAYASATYHSPDVDWNIYLSHFEQETGILRGSITGSLEDLVNAIGAEIPENTSEFSYHINTPRLAVSHDLGRLTMDWYPGKHQVQAMYGIQLNLRQEYDVRRGTNNTVPATDLELIDQQFNIHWRLPEKGNFGTQLGIQGAYQINNNIPGTNTIPFVPNYDQFDVGAYWIQSYQPEKWTYEIGLRYDYRSLMVAGRDSDNDIYRDDLSYNNVSATLGWKSPETKEGWQWRSNLGTAWRAPNVAELYFFGRHQSDFQYGLARYQLFPAVDSIAASEVRPGSFVESERGLKWVHEVQYTTSRLRVIFSSFTQWVENFFFVRPYGITNTVRGPFPFFIYDQTNAWLVGGDLDVEWQHANGWQSSGSLSYVRVRDIRNQAWFIETPPLKMGYSVDRTQGRLQWGADLDYYFRQWQAPPVIPAEDFLQDAVSLDRNQTFDFLETPAAYLLVSAHGSCQVNRWKFRADVENILNQRYRAYTDRMRYFADAPAINLRISVQYQLGKK